MANANSPTKAMRTIFDYIRFPTINPLFLIIFVSVFGVIYLQFLCSVVVVAAGVGT